MAAKATPRATVIARLPSWLTARVAGIALLAVVLVGAAGAAVRWLSHPGTLPITTVRIEGEFHHLSSTTLQTALAERATGGFFSLDVAAVKQAAEALPWVESASVRRVWPDTITLAVKERQPVALWGDNGIVDRNGEIFHPDNLRELSALPRFTGPADSAPNLLERYRQAAALLDPLGMRVVKLTLNNRRAWQAETGSGIVLYLGKGESDAGLRRLVRAFPEALAKDVARIRAIDLRYTNGIAVRWQASAKAST